MMAWDLGGNWSTELLRMRLALQLPVDRINELLPPYPGEKPLPDRRLRGAVSRTEARRRHRRPRRSTRRRRGGRRAAVGRRGRRLQQLGGRRPAHSTTGKPLLANDPHLKLTAPALWYFARLEAPGFKVAGATMPGLPLVVLGQNEHIAWGFTNTAPDVQDLYLEQLHPADANQVQTPDGWARSKTVEEMIHVRGKPDVT